MVVVGGRRQLRRLQFCPSSLLFNKEIYTELKFVTTKVFLEPEIREIGSSIKAMLSGFVISFYFLQSSKLTATLKVVIFDVSLSLFFLPL